MNESMDEAFPAYFKEALEKSRGSLEARSILEGSVARRRTSLRANALKASHGEIARELDAAGISWEAVPWYDDEFLIAEARERDVWPLDAYAQGRIYLQSLSSMIPALVLDPQPGSDVLDMCAAPGGKTTQLAALGAEAARKALGPEPRITACELHAPRAEKLAHNLERQGAGKVNLMRVDARRLDEFFRFDQILLDAPCSGSGTIAAGDARAARRFTPQLVKKSMASQRALLARGLSILKPGGSLVYSTCSVLPCENEELVDSVLKDSRFAGRFEVVANPFPQGLEQGLPLLTARMEGALCLRPTKDYEGFFVLKLKRIG